MTQDCSGIEKFSEASRVFPSQASSFIPQTIKYSSRASQYLKC